MHRKMFVVIGCLLLSGLQQVNGWSQASLEAIASKAVEFMPENIRITVDKFKTDLLTGITEPVESELIGDEMIRKICDYVSFGANSIREDRDFRRAVHAMGRISRCISVALHPLRASGSIESRKYRTDYDIYLERNQSFFRVRWTGIEQRPRDTSQFAMGLERSISKSKSLSITLLDTFASDSRPISQYDQQSIPFGAGSIAYSNAVAQTANAWLLLWQQAGGLNPAIR